MRRSAALAVTALAVTGFTFQQEPGTTLELRGVSDRQVSFTITGDRGRIDLSPQARPSEGAEGKQVAQLSGPAKLRVPPNDPIHLVLASETRADTLQLAVQLHQCEIRGARTMTVIQQGQPTQRAEMEDAAFTCEGGRLRLSAEGRSTVARQDPAGPHRLLLLGQRITLIRASRGAPLEVKVESLPANGR